MSAPASDLKSIFGHALDISSPQERAAYLNVACGNDLGMRQEIESLLEADQRAHGFFDELVLRCGDTIPDSMAEQPGTIIGPYKLMEQIGEGGMGLVFVAEQQHPIRRRVALKVIKPGMDSRQVIARFEAERQALALMDHANIARVLDGGTTASGRPYFVMELVKGVPITQFCDDSQLAPRERLELFLDVCAAVQHAHQKGVIHRDLKPSNVLVMSHDGQSLVKVIDFGVAKALGQQLTEKTVYTLFAQLIGTPLYMSPEQAAESSLDVDTRSDIYSLGVLLYELLTGTTPFEKERLHQLGYEEVRRILQEEEPPKPSTRISTLGLAATTVSTQRRSDPRRLSQLCRGELDWIVMKALEKSRNRRYETAGAFAADVRRYLHHEAVQACPPSAWYRFRKFARRNRKGLGLAAAGLVVLLGLTAAGGWSVQRRSARRAHTAQAVTAALAQASTFLEEADRQTNSSERWQASRLAQTAADKAEELLTEGEATSELADQVRRLRATVDTSVADSHLLVELDPVPRQLLKYGRDVLRTKKGTCINTSILYASLAEAVGLEPLIMVIPGHAFAAVRLPKSGQPVFVETTGGTTTSNAPFDRATVVAQEEFRKAVKAGLFMLVTIKEMRAMGVTPPKLANVDDDILARWQITPPDAAEAADARPAPALGPDAKTAQIVSVRKEANIMRGGLKGTGFHVHLKINKAKDVPCVLLIMCVDSNKELVRTTLPGYSVRGRLANLIDVTPKDDDADWDDLVLFLPYKGFEIGPGKHQFFAVIMVLSDGKLKSESTLVPFALTRGAARTRRHRFVTH